MTTSYTYEPFGRASVSGGPTASRFTYTAREDDNTGLYYYRARYYHPSLGRFLQEDPIGLSGGDLNLFAYVTNNPTRFIDPYGLQTGNSVADYVLGCLKIPSPWLRYECLKVVVESGGLATLSPALREKCLSALQAAVRTLNHEIWTKWDPVQRQLLDKWLNPSGLTGTRAALERLRNFQPPTGITRETLETYAGIARRWIEAGLDKTGIQRLRLEAIERAIREL